MDEYFERLVSTLPLQHPRTYPSSDQIERYFTFAPNRFVQAGKEDFSFGVMISQVNPVSLDYEDKREKPLFKRALKKSGPIEQDEMYAFVPALSLGGSAEVASLEKVK